MAAAVDSRRLSDALVSFSLDGHFPENIAELPPVSETDLEPAIGDLATTKNELEAQIHTINQETKDDVSSWVRNAKSLQDDIIRSKTIANDIIRQAEAPQVSGEAIQNAEARADFLCREVQYSQQLHSVLQKIQNVARLLGNVDRAKNERRVLDSLRLLEQSWTALDQVGVSKSCRVMRLLDLRSFELKTHVHDTLNHIWKSLISVDMDAGKIVIYDALHEDNMTLNDAVIGLKAYKETDERMEQLWRNLDAAIVSPRMNNSASTVPAVKAEADSLELHGQAETSVDALISDLEKVLVFLAHKLPPDLLRSLSSIMMAEVVPRLIQQWLNPAVPPSLTDMASFQNMIRRTNGLGATLEEKGYTGLDELIEWASKAHMTWLNKCRESALDTVRTRLTRGIGESKPVEKVERHMVSLTEGKELVTTGAGATADINDWGEGWGDAWDDDDGDTQDATGSDPRTGIPSDHTKGEDDGADAWGWGEDDDAKKPAEETKIAAGEEDDSADAWGWGDEDATAEPAVEGNKARGASAQERGQKTRELVLKETYHISSMPEPVLDLIFAILEDGAALTKAGNEYDLVAATAPGLFSLPTFALALFRAISPYYYSLNVGGNMFLYNDAMYMAEKLADFSSAWKLRDGLTPRALNMLRLDSDIKTLQNFANRSYGNEMNIQKTVLQDLLGGSQSLMQQDEMEAAVEAGTARIRTMAATWEPILARSVWSQAIGSLADALATRLIGDVLDMSAIGQEEAYSIAKLIASATELDDLFLPSKMGAAADPSADEVPTTAQYAPHWLRLKYLGEVLQSNLNEVRYLWCDSELSLYFSAEEVIDLIGASFEDNARTRETIKEIQSKPEPLVGR
ncbi:centromere/kinetochore zw10 domain-containing protein [Hirsutella rhossiliensis]|uniref:Centromere/kinetochore zw10 domain-containing protein n=1 Tax=Hirsutella rhossiliensis TaxID=111463 RepID=A0A9P8SME9_9HYPO|nr:centromere/kinetochore zw10 domain-containing protein [Hirsutella rhossiliensis]KAH0967936.1 centromere/kinetochore zw10 domain-containing protein [Hirsutella rhossiliensis]